MEDRLKGMPLDRLRDAWDMANRYVENKPELTVIEDLESGYPQVVTKKDAEKLAELFEACRPKANLDFPSKILFFGTGGEIRGNDGWCEIFNSSKDK